MYDKSKFKEDITTGITNVDLARKYGVCMETIARWRQECGLAASQYNKISVDEEQFKRDIDLYSNVVLAQKYGVGLRWVSKKRKQMGKANIWKKECLNAEEFKNDCREMRIHELAKKYNTTMSNIGRWKSIYGLSNKEVKPNRDIIWKEDGNGCWICTSHAVNAFGYPQCKREKLVAKRAWIEVNGDWPVGKVVMHLCDNKLCVNPAHISPGTMKDNQAGMAERNRSPWGNRSGARVLDSDKAKEIFALRGIAAQRAVADKYGVSGTTIGAIWSGKTWVRDIAGMKNSGMPYTFKQGKKKLSVTELDSLLSMKGKQSLRDAAKAYGVSKNTVARIWNSNGDLW